MTNAIKDKKFGKGTVITDFFNSLYMVSCGKKEFSELDQFRDDRFCRMVSLQLEEDFLKNPNYKKETKQRAEGITKLYQLIQNDPESLVNIDFDCDFLRKMAVTTMDAL